MYGMFLGVLVGFGFVVCFLGLMAGFVTFCMRLNPNMAGVLLGFMLAICTVIVAVGFAMPQINR